MFELLLTMLERLGLIVTIAFILTRFRFFREMIYQESLTAKQRWVAVLFFGFFGIFGTYTGVSFDTDTLQFSRWASELSSDEAIANSRVIGVVLAGLFGGYRVGIGAGLVAGVHRFTLGGFTAFSCGLASIFAGIIASILHKRNRHVKLSTAFFIGALAESVQMLIILLLSRPYSKASALVETIGLPMILANGVGCAIFLLIIKSVVNEEEKAAAIQAQKSLRLARQTLKHLRKGMTSDAAEEVCRILYHEVNASAVSITDDERILSHIGVADDHHKSGHLIQTDITRKVLGQGALIIAGRNDISCSSPSCPLGAAAIAPLKERGQTIGTLKFYFKSEKEITNVVIELISGLSMLLSNQLDAARGEKAYQLAKDAEIKALQAQISPHFLFNTLNVIVSLIRIDPKKARKLLLSLSHFLRQNLTGTTLERTTLKEELKHVQAYLEIEEARFSDRLKTEFRIEEEALSAQIPPLTLQPLVENAVKHGIKDKEADCRIIISAAVKKEGTKVSVSDNGAGIETERLLQLARGIVPSLTGTGLGIYNVNRRLAMLFGERAGLNFDSRLNEGTTVSFVLPDKGEE